MKKLKNNYRRLLPLAALCVVAAGTAAAFARQQLASNRAASQGRPEIKVTLSGAVARADESVALDKAGVVHPGEVLDWKITSSNEGDGAARQYKTVGHVPVGTSFVAGSATAEYDGQVSYSIDGGKTFSARPEIEERQADGTVKRVPAPVSMYTQVRYEWADPLAAGRSLVASYKVRVK
jgi:uncharacterized repeat protein (TIGR01451 family)